MDGEIILIILAAVVVLGGGFLLFIVPLISKRIKGGREQGQQPARSSYSVPAGTEPVSPSFSPEIPPDLRSALYNLDNLSSKTRNDQEVLICDLKALKAAGEDASAHAIFWIKQAENIKRERVRTKSMVEALEKTFDPTNELMSRLKAAVEGE